MSFERALVDRLIGLPNCILGFINAKPEGRKTAIGEDQLFNSFDFRTSDHFLILGHQSTFHFNFLARVNVAINNIAAVENILVLAPFTAR